MINIINPIPISVRRVKPTPIYGSLMPKTDHGDKSANDFCVSDVISEGFTRDEFH